jgi:hypothetical protein
MKPKQSADPPISAKQHASEEGDLPLFAPIGSTQPCQLTTRSLRPPIKYKPRRVVMKIFLQ